MTNADHCYFTNEDPCMVFAISPSAVMVLVETLFQTVYIRTWSLRCDCESHRTNCKYIFALKDVLKSESIDEALRLFRANMVPIEKTENLYELTSVSKQSVPFCRYVTKLPPLPLVIGFTAFRVLEYSFKCKLHVAYFKMQLTLLNGCP